MALLLIFRLIGFIFVGMSSIVAILLATVFLIGSAVGSIANAPASMICRTVGPSLFFARALHIASRLPDRATNLVVLIPDFLLA